MVEFYIHFKFSHWLLLINLDNRLNKGDVLMTYIIADPCVGTCDTACVEVCPVDCIHGPEDKEGAGAEAKEPGFDPTDKMLYIDPEECIDCGACEPECPVEAIFEEDAVPEEWKHFIKINYDWFGRDYDE